MTDALPIETRESGGVIELNSRLQGWKSGHLAIWTEETFNMSFEAIKFDREGLSLERETVYMEIVQTF